MLTDFGCGYRAKSGVEQQVGARVVGAVLSQEQDGNKLRFRVVVHPGNAGFIMAIRGPTQRRGRSKTIGPGKEIAVRLQPSLLSALDKFISAESGHLSRPEAIRKLLDDALDQYGFTTGRK